MTLPWRWGWLEVFVVVQYLLNGLLLFPGSQWLRFGIRAAPYLLSLLLLVANLKGCRKEKRPPGAFWVRIALLWGALSLVHPFLDPRAGAAQLLFQLAIVAPVFWGASRVEGPERLLRLLGLIFACSALGSAVGLLQIYFPAHFLPASYSANASGDWVRSLTFVGPNGSLMTRPPGLSDLPGGAAVAGSLAAVLGLGFSSLRRTSNWLRFVWFGGAMVGVTVLYLTQVRSLTVMTILSLLLLGAFSLRQPGLWHRLWLGGAAVVLILGAFLYAVTLGGHAVRDRFLGVTESGLVESYQNSRGYFWDYTLHQGLHDYPLGAGMGRWGMMNFYFGSTSSSSPAPLWAEIQLTGWLYDGGVPLCLFWLAALASSMVFVFRIAGSNRYGETVPLAAAMIFAVNLNVIGASLTGPAFNTTLGIQYWLLIACLCGAARVSWRGPSLRQIRFEFLLRPARAVVPI